MSRTAGYGTAGPPSWPRIQDPLGRITAEADICRRRRQHPAQQGSVYHPLGGCSAIRTEVDERTAFSVYRVTRLGYAATSHNAVYGELSDS